MNIEVLFTSPDREPTSLLLKPMIPRETIHPPRNKDWLVEHKMNGVRGLIQITKGANFPRIVNKNGRDISHALPELNPGLRELARRHSLILDGEIIYGEGKTSRDMRIASGRASRSAFSAREGMDKGRCQFVVFDLLMVDDQLLLEQPLILRKRRLSRLVPVTLSQQLIVVSQYAPGDSRLQEVAKSEGFEGVVYKNLKSPYLPGQKTGSWLKVISNRPTTS